ncbi:MAG: FAD-dependent oxidoreductase [Bacteroidia bacterium]
MGKKVVILGGGVAGMSAAHELSERGFRVSVYELKPFCGGKARSMDVPGSGTATTPALPGEHGFRFFPRFYQHLPDTMKRIPVSGNDNGVFDNLVDANRGEMARYGKPPIELVTRFPRTLNDVEDLLEEVFGGNDTGLQSGDIKYFASRLWQLMTSCAGRRLAEYEQQSWWDFIGADGRSPAYQNLLAVGLTRTLVAAKAREASARTGGDILLQLVFDMLTPGVSSDRLLNAPTNEAWLNPWMNYLRAQQVDYHLNAKLDQFICSGGNISGVSITENGVSSVVAGDYYVSALPVEVIATFVNADMIQADPTLANISLLAPNVSWMNGIQYYLFNDVAIVAGHTIYIDTPWALTSVSQKQFWPAVDLTKRGDGTIQGILSVDISDWDTPGELFSDSNGKFKAARDCTADEISKEVWNQLKKSVNRETEILSDANLHSWFLDPDILIPLPDRPGTKVNVEPLLVNKKDTWKWRPDAKTAIPNFFLASDFVRTNTDLATMEGANEAARRAVNAILEASGSDQDPCQLWDLHEPLLLWPFRERDTIRFNKGLPWDGKLLD